MYKYREKKTKNNISLNKIGDIVELTSKMWDEYSGEPIADEKTIVYSEELEARRLTLIESLADINELIKDLKVVNQETKLK